jgi:phosphoribosylamine--glycine ligase
MAAEGYPGSYQKGKEIKGIKQAESLSDVVVFHAGTVVDGKKILTAGGRVLNVCALGQGIEAAIGRTYQAVEKISWDGCYFRRDIGRKALNRPLVGIIMGSDSDWPILKACKEKLDALGLNCEVKVISAHRTPELSARYARQARARGIKVIIAAAGGAAHLAGALAAQTTLPVIGLPLNATSLAGVDALLSTVQMPPGVPVATVGLDKWGAINAAILAAQIISTTDSTLAQKLDREKEKMRDKVAKADKRVNT